MNNDNARDFYRRLYRLYRRTEQDDLEALYDEGKATYVSGVGFVAKRKTFGPGRQDD